MGIELLGEMRATEAVDLLVAMAAIRTYADGLPSHEARKRLVENGAFLALLGE